MCFGVASDAWSSSFFPSKSECGRRGLFIDNDMQQEDLYFCPQKQQGKTAALTWKNMDVFGVATATVVAMAALLMVVSRVKSHFAATREKSHFDATRAKSHSNAKAKVKQLRRELDEANREKDMAIQCLKFILSDKDELDVPIRTVLASKGKLTVQKTHRTRVENKTMVNPSTKIQNKLKMFADIQSLTSIDPLVFKEAI